MSRVRIALIVGAACALAGTAAVVIVGAAPGATHRAVVRPSALVAHRVPDGWHTTTRSIRIGRSTRSYVVMQPAEIRAALPVLIVLHGRGMTPQTMDARAQLRRAVGPAVFVYPAGYGQSWNAGACCGAAHAAGVDDLDFITELVRQVVASYPSASHRPVLAGYSNGGRMALRAACARPDLFSGVVSVEAVPVSPCTRLSNPLSVLVIASRHDPLLVIDHERRPRRIGTYVQPTVDATVAQWRALDGCKTPVAVRTANALTTWSAACPARTRVALALYDFGGHTWPAGNSAAPPAQKLIADFVHAAAS